MRIRGYALHGSKLPHAGNKRHTKKRLIRLFLGLFLAAHVSSLLALIPAGRAFAAAPTLNSTQSSDWSDVTTGNEVTPTLSWTTGDLIIVLGATENNIRTLNTPTATGLTFTAVTSTNTASNTKVYVWSAVAGGTSSSAVNASQGDGSSAMRGIIAYDYSNATLGASSTLVGSTTSTTVPLTTTQDGSAVAVVLADWNAINDTSVTSSPTGGTVRDAGWISGAATLFAVDLPNVGTAGAGNYGITNFTAGFQMTGAAVEIKGPAGSLDQEGFRFRNDDGNETTASWLAAQDTNISQAADTTTRLRTLLNATGDPSSTQYQLEYKKSTASTYSAIPVALPTAGDVTYGAVGAYAASSGATSRAPALPTGVTSLSELWVAVGSKNNATHTSSSTDWTKVAQQNSGASWTVSLWRYTGADATAASAPTVNWTGSAAAFGQAWREQGRTGIDPIGTPSIGTGTTSTHTSTAVTTTSPGSRVMYVDSSAANAAIATPTSWTENVDNGSGTGATRFAFGGQDFSDNGSSSGDISVTGAAAAWVQMQIELPAEQPSFIMSPSANITASGDNTTAQLAAPSGKTTSNFVTGRMQDDVNPAAAVDITTDDYTELEWSIKAIGTFVSNGDIYTFRVTKGGTALDSYNATPQWTIGTSNTAPSSPSSLVQANTSSTTISTGGWTNETSIKLSAAVTDVDVGDTIKICAEVVPITTALTSPAGDGNGCSATGVSTGGTATMTITGLTDTTEYHWQIRAKDAAGAYSSWVGYGGNTENPPTNPAARDFAIDTTAPTGGTVYDGTVTDTDTTFSDSSLSSLSANWSGFNLTVSGLLKYEYSIGTTAGAVNTKGWTDNSTSTTITATGLTLQTSQMYFINIRATDNAGNTVIRSSNGQLVAPSLSFGVSPSSVTFDNLNAANSYTNTKTTTITTSTNAYGGYVVRAFATDFLRSPAGHTIPDFNGGTYASPDTWQASDTGFGYTSSDTLVQGVNKFQNSTCPGGTALAAPGCYAPFTQTKPGDIIADHTGNVTASPITAEAFTITLRATVPAAQQATNYQAAIVYAITPLY